MSRNFGDYQQKSKNIAQTCCRLSRAQCTKTIDECLWPQIHSYIHNLYLDTMVFKAVSLWGHVID